MLDLAPAPVEARDVAGADALGTPPPRKAMRGWADFFAGRTNPHAKQPAVLPDTPHLLFDDARGDVGGSFLLQDPVRVISATRSEDVVPAMDDLRAALASGLTVAGYIGYEAGAAFEARLPQAACTDGSPPLLWFGCFEQVVRIDGAETLLPAPVPLPSPPIPEWSRDEYCAAVEQVQALIRAGEFYQANLTFPTRQALSANPHAHYAALRQRQQAGWGGFLDAGDDWLASLSPEMFFTAANDELEARPMKGTAPRSPDAMADIALRRGLRECAKERAENLMIVDLIRNDLSRVSAPGSVRVPELFSVESYPTIHQMTSRVTARLAEGRDAIDTLAATFPCGSITGAPKIRAMEILSELESGRRGTYTGSLGVILPDGSAAFNVLIRTLFGRTGQPWATIGVGSGITDGSQAGAEWHECMDKLRFAQ